MFLYNACTDSAWANENHIFAMSKLIGRPIHVYGTFNQAAMQSNTSDDLDSKLRRFEAGGPHNLYLFSNSRSEMIPVSMHHTGPAVANHFTALLRRQYGAPQVSPVSEHFINYRDFNIPLDNVRVARTIDTIPDRYDS